MHSKISAKGYTSVVLVLNMKRFVHQDDKEHFETVRGTLDFANILRHDWRKRASAQDVFVPLKEYKERYADNGLSLSDSMSTEEIAFSTGIFRNIMLEKFTFPVYVLDKEKVKFSDALESNFQFKALFKRAWNRWDIYLHATHTGFFVIRLVQKYEHRPRSFLTFAQEALRLQESLDVPSAQRWLLHNLERYENQPETLAQKERSVRALLTWMGADEKENGQTFYSPVQWKLAMEVAGRFVEQIGRHGTLTSADGNTVRFRVPEPDISIPLHDSYIIHHLDEIFSDPRNVARAKKSKTQKNVQIKVGVRDIRDSPRLRRGLMNLIEGTVLRAPAASDEKNAEKRYFPIPSWRVSDSVFDINQSSWNDEICLLSSRTAIIYPSTKWRNYEMAVSTMPGATLNVQYSQYWQAIERMIEFVLETRVLAQLIDSTSYDLLQNVTDQMHKIRKQLIAGDIKLDRSFLELVTRAAQLRRLAALAQSVTNPRLWSRAEYAIRKAEILFSELGVPQTLSHVEQSIDSINNVVDHVDELYIADLAEKSNDQNTLFSVGLAAGSLILTFLIFPSFFTDTMSVFGHENIATLTWGIWVFLAFGATLSLGLIYFAIRLLKVAWKQRRKVSALLNKFMDGEQE